MASKHKEGLNVKEKVSGGKRGMSEEMRIPILGDDTIYDLFEAFLQELHDKGFIHVPNGTSGMAIVENFYNFIDKQMPDNMVILNQSGRRGASESESV